MDSYEKHLGSVPEDIGDVLSMIEKSYCIRFEEHEIEAIRTFGQLTDHIISKLNLDNKCDCTAQQAFYRLRTAVSMIGDMDKPALGPKTPLADIFPRRRRRIKIKDVEKLLGLNLKVLRPHHFVTNFLLIALVLSFISLFLKWQFGCAGLLVSIFWTSDFRPDRNNVRS